ncbi:uncharacterized protein [Watersipora subatra]|uniref:uncharacterized protein n=1 Tax=Watersipora subatra TaxID=2589382 RepID=UPI00355BF460
MQMLVEGASKEPKTHHAVSIPNFPAFDSTSELWTDYWARFNTFAVAHIITEDRKPKIFFASQSAVTCKILTNLSAQMTPPKVINQLTMAEITGFMKEQYDPKKFIIRERFEFWSEMRHKPGETVQELAARIRQDATTCDFASITNPHEAMRTKLICSVNIEAVLKALFKVKVDELSFTRAVELATETEDAAKVAKETAHGSKATGVNKVQSEKKPTINRPSGFSSSASQGNRLPPSCYRCGKNHLANTCTHNNSQCNFCKELGHIEPAC